MTEENDDKPTLPERLEGESPEEYHTRLQQWREEHPTVAEDKSGLAAAGIDPGTYKDPAELFNGKQEFGEARVDIDPVLIKDHPEVLAQVIKPEGFKDKDPAKSKDDRIIEKCRATGEPYFVFRAKDILSIMVISNYFELVERFTPGNVDIQEAIAERLQEFRDWQQENSHLIRYPD